MIEDFLNQIDAVVATFIIDGYADVAAALETPLRLCLVAFVGVYGYALWFAKADLSLRTAMRHVLLATLVMVLVLHAATGARMVQAIFVEGPSQLAGAIINGGGGSTGGLSDNLSQVWDKGIAAASATWEAAGWRNLAGFGMALLILAVTVFMLIPAVAYLVIAKVGLAVLLVLTPFAVILLLFSPTRGLFEGWLRQTTTFALIPVLVYLILALILNIADQAVDTVTAEAKGAHSNALMPAIGAYLVVGAVSFVLFLQVMNIAGGIGGGVSLSTLGAISSAARGGRRALASPVTAPRAIRDARHTRRARALTKDSYQQLSARRSPAPPPAAPPAAPPARPPATPTATKDNSRTHGTQASTSKPAPPRRGPGPPPTPQKQGGR